MITITYPFSKSRIPNLEPEDWINIQNLVSQPNAIMIYEQKNIAPKSLIAIGSMLSQDGAAEIRMYVYHPCQEDPVAISDKFISGPCPMCNKELESKDTQYALELLTKYCIKFID